MTDVPMERYSQAITEIYELRAALAFEARVVEATLDYATFPKGRRSVHTEQVERMRAAARGDRAGYGPDRVRTDRKAWLRSAGADDGLTNSQWEARQGYSDDDPDASGAVARRLGEGP